MAKIHARNRKEIWTLTKVYDDDPEDKNITDRRHSMVLMNDGVVLSKHTYRRQPFSWETQTLKLENKGWKVWGSVKTLGEIKGLQAELEARGYKEGK